MKGKRRGPVRGQRGLILNRQYSKRGFSKLKVKQQHALQYLLASTFYWTEHWTVCN